MIAVAVEKQIRMEAGKFMDKFEMAETMTSDGSCSKGTGR